MNWSTLGGLLPILLGIVAGALLIAIAAREARRIGRDAREQAERLVTESRREAEGRASEILVAAQEKLVAAQEDTDRREHEIEQREAALDARSRQAETAQAAVEKDRRDIERRLAVVTRREASTLEAEREATRKREEARVALERIAGLTAEQARAELLQSLEDETRKQAAKTARRIEEEARETAHQAALRMVVQAAQRLSMREIAESTIAFIELPSDDLKGRIIGREGRNIRALEQATGIDVVVDDTPRAILVSSFDPIRREIAKASIARLVEDGRIHPARIEEVVAKVRSEFDTLVDEAGAQAAFALGVVELHPRLVRLLGRCKFRFHHGQNLLQHAQEVAWIAGYMAEEMGARADVARRAGLLHEIGRAEEAGGGNTLEIAADLAAKFGEADDVAHAIRALEHGVEPRIVESLLLRIANRVSENRPGARKENLDIFLERLRRLEAIALGFPGVAQAFAVKAGKELRVIVDAAATTDDRAHDLSRDIARAIERDLDYTGQIRVSVVRETRAVQYAV